MSLISPKVSVLMPIYRTKEKHLRATIESVLGQTFTDFEFLILDDCPEDDRECVVGAYSDGRIRYFRNDHNMGITPSRNKLIDLADGEYLAVVDHDDISAPDRFAKEVQYLDEHPSVGVVSSWYEIFPVRKVIRRFSDDHNIKLSLMRQCGLSHPATMIRKSVLEKNGIRYREEYTPAEDYALWCELLPHTEFYNIPEVLLRLRRHRTNTSKLQRQRMRSAALRLNAEMQTKYPGLYNEFMLCSSRKHTFNLFGFLPLVRLETRGYVTKMYLFYFILVGVYEISERMKRN